MPLTQEEKFATDILALRLTIGHLIVEVSNRTDNAYKFVETLRQHALEAAERATMSDLDDAKLPEMREQLQKQVNRFIPRVAN